MDWVTIFTYGPLGIWLLSLFIYVRLLPIRRTGKILVALILLVAFSKFLGFALFGGRAFIPELPELLIWGWDFIYSTALILTVLSGLMLLLRLRRGRCVLLPLLAAALSGWGLWNGVCVPAVHSIELTFANLPRELDGYRLVHLSDLHCSSAARRWRTQAVVDRVNALEPDLICLTGDNADGRSVRIAPELEPVNTLRAREGVYMCTGNHEYYVDHRGWMLNFYARSPIRILTNECVFPNPALALGGVPDQTGFWHKKSVQADVRKVFSRALPGQFRILLQHRPRQARFNCSVCGVDLQLSGHTHGGIAPLMRQLVARANDGFVRGIYHLGASILFVNSGCGQWAGFPLRFFNPSEITLITLRKQPPITVHSVATNGVTIRWFDGDGFLRHLCGRPYTTFLTDVLDESAGR